jgi:hypothetical protein
MSIYPTISDGTQLSTVDEFIPELWSDEIIATYKANLVAAPLAVNMNHVGKKGDTVHIPVPERATPNQKAPLTGVTIIADSVGEKVYVIDQHWEYTKLIEDIVKVQAIDTYRSFYTDDAGYALAKKLDSLLLAEGGGFQNPLARQVSTTPAESDFGTAFLGSDGTTTWTTGNGAPLTDAAIRRSIQRLDDDDVPSSRRVLIVNPAEKNNMLAVSGSSGFDRFNRYDAIGEGGASNQSRNGLIGDLYNVPVYVTTNLPTADGTNNERVCMLFQREALVLFEQMRPRTQTQYKQEYLADLFTADQLYATGLLRPEGGVALVVEA